MGNGARRESERLYADGRWRTTTALAPADALGPLGWLVWRRFRRWAPRRGLGTLVDVGGGEGYAAALWPGSALKVVVDVVPAALAVARARGLAAVGGDACRLPLKDGVAALVLCSDVLEHLPPADVGRALAEGARVMRPGGTLLLHTSSYGLYLRRWLRRAPGRAPLDADDVKDGHQNRMRPAELEAAIRSAGLTVRRRAYYKHLFQPLVALLTRAAAGGEGAAVAAAKEEKLRRPAWRALNRLRLATAALDPLLFGWWLAGGAVIYQLEK